MAIFQNQVTTGMKVIGSDGKEIGTVKEVRATDFLCNRSMARDVYIPFAAVQNVTENRINLNVPSDQIDHQGWANPPIMGSAGH